MFGKARICLVLLAAIGVYVALAAPASAATLKHWWKADNDAVDSVAANNGSLVGNTTFVTGFSNQAFSFDGNDDYVSVPDAASHYPAGSFTVDAYAKTSAGTGAQQIAITYECANSCPTDMASSVWELEVRDGAAFAYVRDADQGGPDNGGQVISGGSGFADGAFHHLIFIRDVGAAKLALYVDGIEVAEEDLDAGVSGALQNTDGEADPLTIGAQIEGGTSTPIDDFNGAVDEVRFLEGAEYPDTTAPVITPNVVGTLGQNGWYTSDVNVGWTITDESIVRTSTGCGTTPLTADTAGQLFTCDATTAGGSNSNNVTVKRDATPPTVTCGAAPSFAQGAGGTVSATVTDALSGPASATASAPADTSSAGSKSAQVTGSDLAGNQASVACPYSVQSTTAGPTGQRAAALKKCKKKKNPIARKKCKKKAKLLPI
jgi:hypothetical protein